MRIGINTNPSVGGGTPATLDQMIEQIAGIERAGFATAGLAQISGLDALTVIGIAGRVVPRIELATAVVPIYGRHPAMLAQQALTTQAAVGGRLLLGLGLSHKPAVEQRWGLSFDKPVEYMREYLTVLLPLLRGEAVAYQGERITANLQLNVAPTPAPSVVLAALGARMLRLAGELTDGTALWMVGPRTLASHITPIITEAARSMGRPVARICVGLPICLTNDSAAARERVARSLGFYGQLPSYRAMLDREGADGPADVLIAGSESEVERQLARLEEGGTTDFLATPVGSREEQGRTREFLASLERHGRAAAV